MNESSIGAVTPIFIDQRDLFSSVFDHLLQSNGVVPDEYLRTTPMGIASRASAAEYVGATQGQPIDNNTGQADSPLSAKGTVQPVLLVSGLLGGSIKSLVAPVMFARTKLVLQGYAIDMAWVNGRSGCDHNARQLREDVLSSSDHHGGAITLVGYSKGCADAMHMLANYPETQSSVSTLVSLAGVVGGTPLADKVGGLTRAVLHSIPIPGVARGDWRAIADLELRYRRDWLRTNHLPDSVRYASLIAAPEAAKVSRILLGGYEVLSETSLSNDSQVIDCDAILPNSELLAVTNADHWAIALPISRRFGRWVQPFVNHNDYPRTVLLQAIIEYLALGPVTENASSVYTPRRIRMTLFSGDYSFGFTNQGHLRLHLFCIGGVGHL